MAVATVHLAARQLHLPRSARGLVQKGLHSMEKIMIANGRVWLIRAICANSTCAEGASAMPRILEALFRHDAPVVLRASLICLPAGLQMREAADVTKAA